METIWLVYVCTVADYIKWIFLKKIWVTSLFQICSWEKVFKDMHEETEEYVNGQIFQELQRSLLHNGMSARENKAFR